MRHYLCLDDGVLAYLGVKGSRPAILGKRRRAVSISSVRPHGRRGADYYAGLFFLSYAYFSVNGNNRVGSE